MLSLFKKGISIVKAVKLSTKFNLPYRGKTAFYQYNNSSARSFATDTIHRNEKEVIATKQENVDADSFIIELNNILEMKTGLKDNVIKILKTKDSEELLHLFEEEIAVRLNLRIEELVIFFYCLSRNVKKNVKNDHRFKNLFEKLFSKIESIPPIFISTLLTTIVMLSIELDTTKKKALADLIYNNSDYFKLKEISIIILFLCNIIPEEQNHDLIISIFKRFAKILIPNMNHFSGVECLNILMAYSKFSDEKVSYQLITALKDNLENIANEKDLHMATRIILILANINIQEEDICEHFYRCLIQGNIQNLDVNDALNLLILFYKKTRNCKDIMRELLKIIVSNLDKITKSEYVKIWVLIPDIKDSSESNDYDVSIQILKEFLFKNNAWDLEPAELNIIIRSTAYLGENDDGFLEQLINFLEPHFRMINNNDLLYLVDTVSCHPQEFSESFLIKIKNECHERTNQFTHEEIRVLQVIFNRLNENLPSSPFEHL